MFPRFRKSNFTSLTLLSLIVLCLSSFPFIVVFLFCFLDGLVVANELQNRRCYMLVHQSKRLHSPCCLITNHDAALFPAMFIKGVSCLV